MLRYDALLWQGVLRVSLPKARVQLVLGSLNDSLVRLGRAAFSRAVKATRPQKKHIGVAEVDWAGRDVGQVRSFSFCLLAVA